MTAGRDGALVTNLTSGVSRSVSAGHSHDRGARHEIVRRSLIRHRESIDA